MKHQFMCGALTATSAIAGLFFLRFWRASGDRIFGFFCLAFCVFASEWIAAAVIAASSSPTSAALLPRALGFALIVLGIVDKNRRDAATASAIGGRECGGSS